MEVDNINWDELYVSVGNYVKKYVSNPYDLEEITHLSVVRVFFNLSSNYEERGKFMPWVFVITRNVIRDYFKGKNGSEVYELIEEAFNIPYPENKNDFDVYFFIDNLHVTINELCDDYKSIMNLYLENRSVLQIANMNDVCCKTIRNKFAKSGEILRILLNLKFHDYLYNTDKFSESFVVDDTKCKNIAGLNNKNNMKLIKKKIYKQIVDNK